MNPNIENDTLLVSVVMHVQKAFLAYRKKNGWDAAHTQRWELRNPMWSFILIDLIYHSTRCHGNNGDLLPMDFEDDYSRNQVGV